MGLSKELKLKLLRRANYKCEIVKNNKRCNSTNNLTPHHLRLKSLGGVDSMENIIIACFDCHRKIQDRQGKWTRKYVYTKKNEK